MNNEKAIALELKNISKSFGNKIANRNVNFDLKKGEILALLGENGSGKTTLMNIISGIYRPDSGEVFVNGKEAIINSPKDAFAYNIGMVYQHFKLIDIFTATENIILGIDNKKEKFKIAESSKCIKAIAEKYGFIFNTDKKIYEMSVSEKQTVEIMKVLYRGADILILDEPTAVLTPQESENLFNVIKKMRDDGKSIIIITHKLSEVLSVSDRVTVMRKGEYIGTVNTCETNENMLTEMMVGEKVSLDIERPTIDDTSERLIIDNINMTSPLGVKLLENVSFTAKSGEILGIAGVANSGQRELLETIAGLRVPEQGKIVYVEPNSNEEINLRQKTPIQIRDLGVRLSFVPEDRLGMGLVGNMDIVDNMMLRSYTKGKTEFLDRSKPKELAEKIIDSLRVVTPSISTKISTLSGGNVQKLLVGRELSSNPTVLMAAYPVRGLDINSSYTIYSMLNEQKKNGAAVIFVGEDLDVLLALCDRILVMASGRISGILDGRKTTKEEVGLLMTKSNFEDNQAKKEND